MTIKEIRELSGLTQKEFSELLNIPKRTIENWETGKRKCPDYVRELIEFRITYSMAMINLIANKLVEITKKE